MFKNYIKKYYLVYIIVAFCIALDLITKAIFDDVNYSVIAKVLSFVSVKNTGGAFSMLSKNTVVLTIFSSIFIVVIIVADKFFKENSKLYKVAYSLIIAGGIGNLFDRIIFGYVRDFIRLDFLDFTTINTVFNVADICVTFGICLFVIYFLQQIFKEKKNEVWVWVWQKWTN